jgi:hypothetical protein
MKKIMICLLSILPSAAFSQFDADSLVKNYKLNFALPDYPAFKSLNVDPSNLLRPSNVTDFGVIASEFADGNRLAFPSAFAMEVSPVLLMNVNEMTLSEYQKNNAWKTSRFSLGTLRDAGMTSKIALGYRISLINKGDLRIDRAALKEMSGMLEARSQTRGELRTKYLQEHGINPFDITDSIETEIEAYIEAYIDVKKEEFDLIIKEFKEDYENKNWNAEKFDLAFALTGSSSDSLIKSIDYSSFQFWATYAHPLLKHRGQFLIGLNVQNYLIAGKSFNLVSLSNRNYLGNNKVKVFIEEQLEYSNETRSGYVLLNLGGEVNISGGLWIDLNAGLTTELQDDASGFISQFRFRYTLPDQK